MDAVSRGQKAAESRRQNTRAETEFIANTYFEFVQFSRGTGISSLSEINSNFDNMIKSYIQLGKIKQESYNKFKVYVQTSNISPLTLPKETFVRNLCDGFERSIASTNPNMMSNLEEDFYNLLKKYNITCHKTIGKILFIAFGKNIAGMYRDAALNNYFDKVAENANLGKIRFKAPEILLRESDGCSGSRDVYGSIWSNMDKLKD